MHTSIGTSEIIELCEAFLENKQLPRTYFVGKLDKYWKPTLLARWEGESRHYQHNVLRLSICFEKLAYWDKDLWDRIIDHVHTMRRIQSIKFVIAYYEMFIRINKDKANPFFGKLTPQVAKLRDRLDRRDWHYNVDTHEYRGYEDWLKDYSKLTYDETIAIFKKYHRLSPEQDRVVSERRLRQEAAERQKQELLALKSTYKRNIYLEKEKAKKAEGKDKPAPAKKAEEPEEEEVDDKKKKHKGKK